MTLLDWANRVAFGALQNSLPVRDADDIDEDWEPRFEARVSADYRDLDKWPRDKVYPWREYGWPGDKSRAMPSGRLPWERLDTLVLHTTDTGGLGPQRFLGVPAHAGIDRDGGIVLCHDLDRRLPHAHAANRYSTGLEVSGKRTITAEQVEAGRLYIRWWHHRVRQQKKATARTLYIAPHRHSHWSRRKDPDREVWEALGEWAIDAGLCELGRVVGSGVRVPERGRPW